MLSPGCLLFCDSGDTPANDRTAVKSRLNYEQIRVCPRGTADMRVNNDDGFVRSVNGP